MIKQNKEFIQAFRQEHPEAFPRVLEVGSRIAGLGGGEEIRTYFGDATEYIGSDMEGGPNVDIVVNGHDLVKEFGENSFDMVLCLDTLEHDDAFWLTAEQMRRVVKPGGWMIICTPGPHCPEHNHPGDYWRFMPQSMQQLFGNFAEFIMESPCFDPSNHRPENFCEIMGKGMKPL